MHKKNIEQAEADLICTKAAQFQGDTSFSRVLHDLHWVIHKGRDCINVCWQLVFLNFLNRPDEIRRSFRQVINESLEDTKDVFEKLIDGRDQCVVSIKFINEKGCIETVMSTDRQRYDSKILKAEDHTAVKK